MKLPEFVTLGWKNRTKAELALMADLQQAFPDIVTISVFPIRH
jgi:hypothetical protein